MQLDGAIYYIYIIIYLYIYFIYFIYLSLYDPAGGAEIGGPTYVRTPGEALGGRCNAGCNARTWVGNRVEAPRRNMHCRLQCKGTGGARGVREKTGGGNREEEKAMIEKRDERKR